MNRAELKEAYRSGFEKDPEETACERVEEIIKRDMGRDLPANQELLLEICRDPAEGPLAEAVIRVMCWQKYRPGSKAWREELVRAGLAHPEYAVRDRTMELVEMWKEEGMPALSEHQERDRYLEQTRRDILAQHRKKAGQEEE